MAKESDILRLAFAGCHGVLPELSGSRTTRDENGLTRATAWGVVFFGVLFCFRERNARSAVVPGFNASQSNSGPAIIARYGTARTRVCGIEAKQSRVTDNSHVCALIVGRKPRPPPGERGRSAAQRYASAEAQVRMSGRIEEWNRCLFLRTKVPDERTQNPNSQVFPYVFASQQMMERKHYRSLYGVGPGRPGTLPEFANRRGKCLFANTTGHSLPGSIVV